MSRPFFFKPLYQIYFGEKVLELMFISLIALLTPLKWQTLFEILFNKIPDYSTFRVFGYLCFVHVISFNKLST